MVAHDVLQWCVMLAQAADKPRLPEPQRTFALMAILGIALLGMLLIVFILLGGHWVRRIGSHRRRHVVPPDVIMPGEQDAAEPPAGDPDRPTDETTLTQDTKNA